MPGPAAISPSVGGLGRHRRPDERGHDRRYPKSDLQAMAKSSRCWQARSVYRREMVCGVQPKASNKTMKILLFLSIAKTTRLRPLNAPF